MGWLRYIFKKSEQSQLVSSYLPIQKLKAHLLHLLIHILLQLKVFDVIYLMYGFCYCNHEQGLLLEET